MYLSQLTAPPVPPVPVAELSGHLRLGTGFADDGAEDALLASFIDSATAAIERALGLAMVSRSFELILAHWDRDGGVRFPAGPVVAVNSVSVEGLAVDPARWTLIEGRPWRLAPVGVPLPEPDPDKRIRIRFDAGHGLTAGDVPADLRQAVTMLAADYYEHRNGRGFSEPGFPPAVEALIARHRPARL